MTAQQLVNFPVVIPYASVAFADTYFAQMISRRALWAALPADDVTKPVDKLGALKEATMVLDTQFYIGIKLFISQEREWPRFTNMGTLGDIFYLDQKIPLAVALATCEQAIYTVNTILQGAQTENRLDHQSQGIFSSSRVGGQESADPKFARRDSLCQASRNLLRPFLNKSGTLEAPYTMRRG
jgi:hypothetical protein